MDRYFEATNINDHAGVSRTTTEGFYMARDGTRDYTCICNMKPVLFAPESEFRDTFASVPDFGSSRDVEEGNSAGENRAPFSGFAISASSCLSLLLLLIYGP